MPAGVVVGGLTQVPDFTVSPRRAKQLESVMFDASDPKLDADAGRLLRGTSAMAAADRAGSASHQYRDAGTLSVTLTVTDTGGSKGSRSKSIAVGTSRRSDGRLRLLAERPRASARTSSSTAPSSTAVSPRTIVSYDWQFGTGRSGSGMIVRKKYDTPGTYNVTLTVTDDAGNKGTSSQGVTVGTSSAGGLTAAFTFSPIAPDGRLRR